MHSFTPLHKTYSVVSSNCSLSIGTIHTGDQKLVFGSQPKSDKQAPRSVARHSFLIRVIIFALLEFGFIALASAALQNPIILHLSLTITEVKGAITAIAILWHALAIYVVKDILLNIFSAEWIKQDGKSRSLTLQELDVVSRLTTGFVDQVGHFVSNRATGGFRLAFLSFLLLIVLKTLGPSAIGVNHILCDFPGTTQVANLTVGAAGYIRGGYEAATHRASLITQLEIIENFTTSGYRVTQPNILIPWPSSDSISENTSMTYQSDIIRYDFNCSWMMPSKSDFDVGLWAVADSEWTMYATGSQPRLFLDPTIWPLQRVNTTTGLLEFPNIGSDSFTSYIFVGNNVSLSTTETYLNLGDIPSFILPCNTTMNPTFSVEGFSVTCRPLSVAILVCDPQLEVFPATINATSSSLEATILSGNPAVKNIPPDAANTIFSSSLLGITAEEPVFGQLNAIFSQLFLPDLPPQSINTDSIVSVKPLALQEINKNMNNILASSAKTYLSGYKPDDENPTRPSFAAVTTSAIMEVQEMALVGSKPFLVISSAAAGLLVVLLGVLVAITRPDRLECFELENIVEKLQLNHHSLKDPQ